MAYLMALALTLLIEGAVIFLFGLRTMRDQAQVGLVNGITHPLFHALILLIAIPHWKGAPDIAMTLFTFEALITITEWFVLSRLYPKSGKLFLLVASLSMNTASAAIGSFLF